MKRRDIKQPVKNGVAKVPVIMQLEALECGAASLAMLMAYYDKWVPLEQVRSDCGVSRDGFCGGKQQRSRGGFKRQAAGLYPAESADRAVYRR